MEKLYGIVMALFLIAVASPYVYAARLPTVGSDSDTWGTVLNNYLLAEHGPNGTHTNITAENVTVSNRFCIGTDCRDVWPAGGGNLTGVGSGSYVANFYNASFLTTGSLIDNGLYFHFMYGNGTQINITDLFLGGINLTERLAADNGTQGALISSLTTQQTADNATQNLAINARANNSDLAANSTRLDALYTTQSADNSTITSNVSEIYTRNMANNATIAASMVTLGAENTFTAKWNYFANVSMVRLNTTDIFVVQLGNLTDYLISNNATIAANLSSLNTRLNTQISIQATDNSTIAANLTDMNSRIVNLANLQAADNGTAAANVSEIYTRTMANNATIAANIVTLGAENTFTAKWNFFNNVSFA